MSINADAIDKLLSARDPDMALVYLYFCKTGAADVDTVSKGLLMPRQRTSAALEKLELSGLIGEKDQKMDSAGGETEQTIPSREEAKARGSYDKVFAAIVKEAEKMMRHQASVPDLQKLLNIYENYGLAPETLMLLIHYVADSYNERYGDAKRPSMRAMEREALSWREYGVTDLASSEQFIQSLQVRKEREESIKEAIGIIERPFTDTERNYVRTWIDWGLSPELIAKAYDRAVTSRRTFSPAYVNGILRNWKAKGIHTVLDLEEKELPKSRKISEKNKTQEIDAKLIQELMSEIENMQK